MLIMAELGRSVHEGVCRCCLERGAFDKEDNLLSAIPVDSDNNAAYSNMLLTCLSLNVTISESKFENNFICDSCIVRLKDAFAFKAQVEEAQAIWEIKFKCGNKLFEVDEDVKNDSPDELWGVECLDEDRDVVLNQTWDHEYLVERPMKHRKTSVETANNLTFSYKTNWDIIRRECGTKDVSSQQWKAHVNSKVCWDTLRCFICIEQFEKKLQLLQHLNEHFPVYTCCSCQKSFSTKRRIAKHIWSHEYGAYKCNTCKLVFYNRVAFKIHLRKHAPLLRYPCHKCPLRFKDGHKRTLHMVAAHNAPAKPYKCNVPGCKSAFLVAPKLKAHISRVHLRERKKLCSECGDGFHSNFDLTRHKRKCNKEFKKICSECGLGFYSNFDLNKHKKKCGKEGLNKYHCIECDESFETKTILKDHNKIHMKDVKILKIERD